MIIVKIRGGLGNQMFQYACARNIQLSSGNKIILDVSDYDYDDQREFSLSYLNLKSDVEVEKSSKYNKIYDRRQNKLLRIISKFFPKSTYRVLSKFNIFIWENISYTEIKPTSLTNIFLNGYWQSEQYFSEIQPLLMQELKVQFPVAERNQELLKNIQTTNSVCVHIRRGDYLLPKNHLYVCDEKYYYTAMEQITKKIDNAIFYIFSDDINSVLESFDFSKFRDVVPVYQRNMDYEELELMYSCKHFIISNSSFSWWAQYLCENPEKKVLAPDIWYDDLRETNIHMDHWEIIPTGNINKK